MRKSSRRAPLFTATALGGIAKHVLGRVQDAVGSSDDVAEKEFGNRLEAQISSVCPTVGDDVRRIWYEVCHAPALRVVIHAETIGATTDSITTEFAISWDDLPDRHRRELILNKRFARVVFARTANGEEV